MNKLRQTARQQLEQFLSALFRPEDLIELRFIESWLSQGKKQSRVVQAAQWLQRHDVIARQDKFSKFAKRTRANLFFGVCPRSHEGDAGDQSIETVRCVWCDIDRTTAADAYRRWKAAGILQPSIVVSSGSGIHAYWLLEQDLHSPEDRLRLAAMLPRFYEDFGGDHVQNLSRVMRLPGTFNYKDARNGRPPQACTLGGCDADLRYPLQAFSRWFDQAEKEQPSGSPAASRKAVSQVLTDQARCGPAEVRELVDRLDRPSRDRSRRDFAIVCNLLRLGLSAEEIWELVSGTSKFESGGRPYFDLTITSAERTVLVDQTDHSQLRPVT
jgi:hypothetical protein